MSIWMITGKCFTPAEGCREIFRWWLNALQDPPAGALSCKKRSTLVRRCPWYQPALPGRTRPLPAPSHHNTTLYDWTPCISQCMCAATEYSKYTEVNICPLSPLSVSVLSVKLEQAVDFSHAQNKRSQTRAEAAQSGPHRAPHLSWLPDKGTFSELQWWMPPSVSPAGAARRTARNRTLLFLLFISRLLHQPMKNRDAGCRDVAPPLRNPCIITASREARRHRVLSWLRPLSGYLVSLFDDSVGACAVEGYQGVVRG